MTANRRRRPRTRTRVLNTLALLTPYAWVIAAAVLIIATANNGPHISVTGSDTPVTTRSAP